MNPKMPLVSTYSPVQFSLAAGVSGGNAVSGNSSTCRAGRGPLLSRSFRVSTQVILPLAESAPRAIFPASTPCSAARPNSHRTGTSKSSSVPCS